MHFLWNKEAREEGVGWSCSFDGSEYLTWGFSAQVPDAGRNEGLNGSALPLPYQPCVHFS